MRTEAELRTEADMRERALQLADGFVRHLGASVFGHAEPGTVTDRAQKYLEFLRGNHPDAGKKVQVS